MNWGNWRVYVLFLLVLIWDAQISIFGIKGGCLTELNPITNLFSLGFGIQIIASIIFIKSFYAVIYFAVAFILPVALEKENYVKKARMKFLLCRKIPQYLLWILVTGLIFIGVIPGIFFIMHYLMVHNMTI